MTTEDNKQLAISALRAIVAIANPTFLIFANDLRPIDLNLHSVFRILYKERSKRGIKPTIDFLMNVPLDSVPYGRTKEEVPTEMIRDAIFYLREMAGIQAIPALRRIADTNREIASAVREDGELLYHERVPNSYERSLAEGAIRIIQEAQAKQVDDSTQTVQNSNDKNTEIKDSALPLVQETFVPIQQPVNPVVVPISTKLSVNVPCALCGALDPQQQRNFTVQQKQSISHKRERVTTFSYNNIPVCDRCARKIDTKERLERIAAVFAVLFFGLGLLFSSIESLDYLRNWVVPLLVVAGVLYLIAKFMGEGHKAKVDAWIAKYGKR